MATTTPIDNLKEAHRGVWNSGDYADVAERFVTSLGQVALTSAALKPGERVLDVATGSGNAAIPAARAGAEVTGLDLASSLLEVAERRSAEAGVSVEWIEGDAEILPFENESFEAVLSVVGVQFASRHEVVAQELARVVSPGGRIVLCSWTPSGFIGQFLKTVAPRMPAAPEGASPPPLWGDAEHVSNLFAELGVRFEFELHRAEFDYGSAAGFVDYMAYHYGPLLKARERLSDSGEWDELRSDLIALSERFNDATDGFCASSEYLLAHGVKVSS